LELRLAQKERMKDKEIEREHICFGKAKDNNYTQLLAQESKHLNIQEQANKHYDKADTTNKKKHIQKITTDRENFGTGVARVAQAARNIQMASNDGKFPNPRGVDLQWVSFVTRLSSLLLSLPVLTINVATAMQDMDQMLSTRSTYHQPTLTQTEFVQPNGRLIPSGLQCTIDQATGDPFYVKED
jgi:hypothetical protein